MATNRGGKQCKKPAKCSVKCHRMQLATRDLETGLMIQLPIHSANPRLQRMRQTDHGIVYINIFKHFMRIIVGQDAALALGGTLTWFTSCGRLRRRGRCINFKPNIICISLAYRFPFPTFSSSRRKLTPPSLVFILLLKFPSKSNKSCYPLIIIYCILIVTFDFSFHWVWIMGSSLAFEHNWLQYLICNEID